MRDAMGGSVVIVIIVLFIVFSLGYLAFNVNYTKAFRMKDKIISLYDDYDGKCTSKCQSAIKAYAREIGYATGNDLHCPTSTSVNAHPFENKDGLYCAQVNEIVSKDEITVAGDAKTKKYYTIVTKINLQIPVISNIIDFRFFYISGDTRTFTD